MRTPCYLDFFLLKPIEILILSVNLKIICVSLEASLHDRLNVDFKYTLKSIDGESD